MQTYNQLSFRECVPSMYMLTIYLGIEKIWQRNYLDIHWGILEKAFVVAVCGRNITQQLFNGKKVELFC